MGLTVWVVGHWRCGTNWVTTLCKPLVERVIADSDVTDNSGIQRFRTDYPELKFVPGGLEQFKRYSSFACKINCLRRAQAEEILELFPESKFLRVTRNDADTITSIATPKRSSRPARNFGMSVDEARTFVETWTVEHYYLHSEERFKDRTHVVAYERLVADLEAEYGRLRDWLLGEPAQ